MYLIDILIVVFNIVNTIKTGRLFAQEEDENEEESGGDESGSEGEDEEESGDEGMEEDETEPGGGGGSGKLKKSAAALTVGMGSFSDPGKFRGSVLILKLLYYYIFQAVHSYQSTQKGNKVYMLNHFV